MPLMNMFQGQKSAAKHVTKTNHRLHEEDARKSPQNKSPGMRAPDQAQPRDVWGEAVHDDDGNHKSDLEKLEDKIRELEDDQENTNKVTETPRQRRFNLFMGGVVVLNIFAIALEIDWGPDDETQSRVVDGWFVLESIFIMLFLFEIGVRVAWEGKRWPRIAWNWFDVIVVACAIIDVWILQMVTDGASNLNSLTILRISRLIRLVRMVKLVRMLGGLYIMVMAFWHALQSMFFLGLMMVFGMLIYAIFAVTLIGRNDSFDDVRIGPEQDTVYDRFGTVYRSMYSLFEIMTLEGWEQVARPLVTKQPLTFLFIGSFILIFTFGMLNMIVALVVQKTLEQTSRVDEQEQREQRRQIEQELNMMKDMFMTGTPAVDARSSQEASQGLTTTLTSQNLSSSSRNQPVQITAEQFERAMLENDTFRKHVMGIGVQPTEARELFDVLDWDQSGEVTVRELMDGFAKLQAASISPWDAMSTHAGVRRVQSRLEELQRDLASVAAQQAERQALLESRIKDQAEVLHEAMAYLRKPAQMVRQPTG